MSTNYIKPQLSAGFRDYLPKDQIPRQKIIKTIQNVFESFGFVPLKTPAIERKINLTGGKDLDMEIFKAKLEGSSKELALRFDLTVPLARVISANPKLEKPFKRYQVGRVWRGERPQDGRYREFLQFDADIIGTKSLMADSEIVAVMFETMKALGVNNFLIKLNNRKILNGLSQYIGFDKKKTRDVLRIIDKKDKKSWPELEQEFKKEVKLSNDQIKKIKEFISIKPGKEELLNKVKKLMAQSKQALVGVGELLQITKNLKALGVDDKNWDIDLSVARGLGYYTGTVFETILTDLPEIGSIFSGGRYDNLVNRFSPADISGVGASIGVDRFFVAMDKLGLIKNVKTKTRVIVLPLNKECFSESQKIVSQLRQNNISAEVYLGEADSFKEKIIYAAKKQIPVSVIIGPDEIKKKLVQIKDMEKEKQIEVKIDNFIEKIKEII